MLSNFEYTEVLLVETMANDIYILQLIYSSIFDCNNAVVFIPDHFNSSMLCSVVFVLLM